MDEIISWTIKIYSSRFLILWIPFLITSIPTIAVEVIFLSPILANLESYMTNQVRVAYMDPFLFDSSLIAIGAILAILSFFLESFVYDFTTVAANAQMKKDETKITSLLNETYKKYWTYIATTILIGVCILAAFLLPFLLLISLGYSSVIIAVLLFIVEVVGAFYFSVKLSLYTQVIYLEDAGSLSSLRRSFELLKGRGFLTLALIIVMILITAIPSFVISPVTSMLGVNLLIIGTIISVLIGTLATPLLPIALTVYYHSMRNRQLPRPPPPPPPF